MSEVPMARTLGFDLPPRPEPCRAAAPLVVNGGLYVGCTLPKGHEGRHKTYVEWGDGGIQVSALL